MPVGGLRVVAASVLVFACAATGVALAALKPVPLSARVIHTGEFPGFVAFAPPTMYRTPKQWVGIEGLPPAQGLAVVTRLRREGFAAVASRSLGTPRREPWSGLSWAMQLRSAAAAQAELAAEIRDARHITARPTTYAAFAVRGIPGARGYRLASPAGMGDNVQFADGPFVYLVGYGWSGTPKNLPARTRLIAAVARLYRRLHGHPPG